MRRLSLWPYLALWALLVGVQAWALVTWVPERVPLALAVALGAQFLKLPVVVGRLRDLGRPADDALLALVPLANLGLWGQLNRGTPADDVRERRRAKWIDEHTALQAWARGLRGVIGSAGAAIPLAILFGGLFAAGELWMVDALLSVGDLDERTQQIVTQGLTVAAVGLGLYTVLQIIKRETASRASWLPTFLLPPVVLSLAAVSVSTAPSTGSPADPSQGMAPLVLSAGAFGLGWMCIMGAALAVLWVSVAQAQEQGGSVGLGEAVGRMFRRTADVSAVHGGAALAIQIGLQVVIPGIHYALQFAFVDAVGVLRPDTPAFKTSTRLTKGIRRRIFKIYTLGFLGSLVVGWLVAFPIEWWLHRGDLGLGGVAGSVAGGVPTLMLALPVHLTPLSGWSLFAIMAGSMLMMGAARVGLVHVYRDRAAAADDEAGGEAAASA